MTRRRGPQWHVARPCPCRWSMSYINPLAAQILLIAEDPLVWPRLLDLFPDAPTRRTGS